MKIPCPKCDNMTIYNSHRKVFECTRCHGTFDVSTILSYHSTPELKQKISDLEFDNIENIEQLRQLKQSINDNICRINTFQFLLKYDKNETPEPKKKHKKYMEIGDAPFPVGLNNKKCRDPVAICQSKNCYLSYTDIHKKKCMMRNCHALQWIDCNKI